MGILLMALALMAVVASSTSYLIYSVAVANVYKVAEDRVSGAAAQIENHLNTTRNVHWVAADTVDYMARSGKASWDILSYITEETERYERQSDGLDENYGSLYGYIGGEYLDGLMGLASSEEYDPTSQAWYADAVKAGGESVSGAPYVDVYTHATVVSISRALSNTLTGTGRRDVLAFDIHMKRVQDLVGRLRIRSGGYAFIVDEGGRLIAHRDITQNGRSLNETARGRALMDRLMGTRGGHFEAILDGRANSVFVHQIIDRWRLAVIVDNEELHTEAWQQVGTTVFICAVIFMLITVMGYLGFKNELTYSRRIEEMKLEEQRQAYEARALRLEKEAADRASRFKSEFLAEMSHEIRTPINAVLGMNEMILRESGDATIRAYASSMESAGRNLLAIVNDILDFSKIEAGRMEIACAPYRLSSLLNDIGNMILFRAQSKDIAFDLDVEETLPDALYGDEVRVRQVISNILSNAIQYTHEGRVTLRVWGTREGGGLTLIASVEDTGAGIRDEDMKGLFDRIERPDAARDGAFGRSGLGLPITQNLLRMMNGSIHAESVYGKGSTFTVAIPQGVVSEEPIGNFRERFAQGAREAGACRETFRAPEARLLVVDDTEMNLTVIRGLLRETELQIDTASSGADALALTKDTPYDLIFMDQRMPWMDGTEALRRIRGQEGGRNNGTPVICLTADAVQGAKERYLAEGFTDYLSKPVEAPAIEAALMKYLPPEKVEKIERAERTPDLSEAGSIEARLPELPDTLSALYAAAGGLDYQSALRYLISDDLLEKTLRQFYEATPAKADEIERLLADGDYENYTIKVHALKSSARLIGAAGLSESARYLEDCGAAVSRGKQGQPAG